MREGYRMFYCVPVCSLLHHWQSGGHEFDPRQLHQCKSNIINSLKLPQFFVLFPFPFIFRSHLPNIYHRCSPDRRQNRTIDNCLPLKKDSLRFKGDILRLVLISNFVLIAHLSYNRICCEPYSQFPVGALSDKWFQRRSIEN